MSPQPAAVDRSTAPAEEFTAALTSWEAREADPDGWEQRVRALARVISDPGSVLPRREFMRGEYETVSSWAARAALVTLAPAPQVDTAHIRALEARIAAGLALADELDADELGPSWLVLHRRPRPDAWVKSRAAANGIRRALTAPPTVEEKTDE